MIPLTVLAGAVFLVLVLGLAVCEGYSGLRVPMLTLEIIAGAAGKLGTLRFQEAYRLAWLTWRLYRMDDVQVARLLAAVEARQARALAQPSGKG
jgi:hypothetical protein